MILWKEVIGGRACLSKPLICCVWRGERNKFLSFCFVAGGVLLRHRGERRRWRWGEILLVWITQFHSPTAFCQLTSTWYWYTVNRDSGILSYVREHFLQGPKNKMCFFSSAGVDCLNYIQYAGLVVNGLKLKESWGNILIYILAKSEMRRSIPLSFL